MRKDRYSWQEMWRIARIIWIPAGIAILILAEIDGGLADGVVMACSGMGKLAHCRWASVVQEPAYVKNVIESWWCLLGISLLCCYITYSRAVVREAKASSQ